MLSNVLKELNTHLKKKIALFCSYVGLTSRHKLILKHK